MSKPVVTVQIRALRATPGGYTIFLGNAEKAGELQAHGWRKRIDAVLVLCGRPIADTVSDLKRQGFGGPLGVSKAGKRASAQRVALLGCRRMLRTGTGLLARME